MDTTPPVLRALIGSAVRWLISLVAGFIVAHEWVSKEALNGAIASPAFTNVVAGIALAFGALAWSQWQKLQQRFAIKTALELPPFSTVEKLHEEIAERKEEGASVIAP